LEAGKGEGGEQGENAIEGGDFVDYLDKENKRCTGSQGHEMEKFLGRIRISYGEI
jgi:hypothetical protein